MGFFLFVLVFDVDDLADAAAVPAFLPAGFDGLCFFVFKVFFPSALFVPAFLKASGRAFGVGFFRAVDLFAALIAGLRVGDFFAREAREVLFRFGAAFFFVADFLTVF